MTKATVFSIETDVPVPEDAKRASTRELVPIDRLKPGESILFPTKLRPTVATLASRLNRAGLQFTIKKVDNENARIWRVE